MSSHSQGIRLSFLRKQVFDEVIQSLPQGLTVFLTSVSRCAVPIARSAARIRRWSSVERTSRNLSAAATRKMISPAWAPTGYRDCATPEVTASFTTATGSVARNTHLDRAAAPSIQSFCRPRAGSSSTGCAPRLTH